MLAAARPNRSSLPSGILPKWSSIPTKMTLTATNAPVKIAARLTRTV